MVHTILYKQQQHHGNLNMEQGLEQKFKSQKNSPKLEKYVNFNTVNNLDIESYVGTFSPNQLVYTKLSFPVEKKSNHKKFHQK
jgi:hypothetical protein